jgi:IS5 family transposase
MRGNTDVKTSMMMMMMFPKFQPASGGVANTHPGVANWNKTILLPEREARHPFFWVGQLQMSPLWLAALIALQETLNKIPDRQHTHQHNNTHVHYATQSLTNNTHFAAITPHHIGSTRNAHRQN